MIVLSPDLRVEIIAQGLRVVSTEEDVVDEFGVLAFPDTEIGELGKGTIHTVHHPNPDFQGAIVNHLTGSQGMRRAVFTKVQVNLSDFE